MDLRLFAGTLGVAAALVACGGGGGTTPPTNIPTPTSTAVATASTTPGVTSASGTVVDDGTGLPLAGVAVKLMPWAPCGPTPAPATSITPENDGCPTPLPSPQVTTAANGTFTLNGVQNGHYLLVIGADAVATVPPGYTTPPGNCGGPCPTPSPVNFTVQATVHDNVTLTGVSQTLVAPTLPSVPSGYTAPAWETNGDYRLATLNATTEMPCLIAWQYERAQNGLAGSSVDEWLLENVRADNAYAQVAAPGSTKSVLTSGNDPVIGGVACAQSIADAFVAPNAVYSYATEPRALWFAGQYAIYSANGGTGNEAAGLAEFPIDPRSFADPSHPTWP